MNIKKLIRIKINRYFKNNEECVWGFASITCFFLFILTKFGMIYNLLLIGSVCALRCNIIVKAKKKRGGTKNESI
ncbi:hypothetical protein DVW05_10090 [Clostridium botulinum]|nr:hypothetical protein [Clostridium botulinum]